MCERRTDATGAAGKKRSEQYSLVSSLCVLCTTSKCVCFDYVGGRKAAHPKGDNNNNSASITYKGSKQLTDGTRLCTTQTGNACKLHQQGIDSRHTSYLITSHSATLVQPASTTSVTTNPCCSTTGKHKNAPQECTTMITRFGYI